MPSTAVLSTIDIAIWFSEKARQEDDYLQPQKLQRLLYLAQGTFAGLNFGRKLMPAIFIADETGPFEPNIYRLFENGPPKIKPHKIPPEIENFLYGIWRRYSHHSTEHINQQIQHHNIYINAIKKGINEEIYFKDIVSFFTGQDKAAKNKKMMIKTKDGRNLARWIPTVQATAKPANKG